MKKVSIFIFVSVLISIFISCSFKNPYDPDNNIGMDDELDITRLSYTKLQLNWNKSDDVKTGYIIWRKNGGNSEFVKIGETGKDADSFADTTILNDDINYTYQVKGHNDENFTNAVEKDYHCEELKTTFNNISQASQTKVIINFTDNSPFNRTIYLIREEAGKKGLNYKRLLVDNKSVFIDTLGNYQDSLSMSVTIEGNIPGVEYNYSIETETDYETKMTTQSKSIVLLPVKNLISEVVQNTVTLRWENYDEDDQTALQQANFGYEIYENDVLKHTITDWITSDYQISGLSNNNYVYKVQTFLQGAASVSSSTSCEVNFAYPPSNLTGSFSSFSCVNELSWDAPAKNSKDIDGYNVYRSTDGISYGVPVYTTMNAFTDTEIENANGYYYHVTSVYSSDDESSPSEDILVEVNLQITLNIDIPTGQTWNEETEYAVPFTTQLAIPYDGLDINRTTFSLEQNSHFTIISTQANTITLIPDENMNGNLSLALLLDYNNSFASADDNTTVYIANINDAPSITSTAIVSVLQDDNYNYLLTATDPDNDDLEFSAVNQLPSWLNLVDNSNGTATLSGVPDNNQVGDSNIRIQVSDGVLTDSQQYTLSVINVNDMPYFEYMGEDYSSGQTVSLDVTEDNDSTFILTVQDIDQDTQGFVWDSIEEVNCSVTIQPGKRISEMAYISVLPDENYFGNDASFTIEVNDETGRVVSELNFNLEVAPVSDPPVFVSTAILSIDQDELYEYNIVAYDPDNEPLTISVLGELPGWLEFSDNGDGNALLTGTPSNDDIGEKHIELTVTDGLFTANQDFVLTINNVNDAPYFEYDSHTYNSGDGIQVNVTEDSNVTFELTAHDIDAEAHYYEWDYSNALHGTVEINNNRLFSETVQITFTPDADYAGDEASFVITVNDENERTVSELHVELMIAPLNDGPEFTSTPITNATQNQQYVYNISATDVDNDPLEITNIGILPGWLQLTDNEDGTAILSGTPSSEDIGSYSIRLQVTDGILNDTQVYTLTVADVNDPPYFEYNGTEYSDGETVDISAQEDHSLEISLTGHDDDDATHEFIWAIVSQEHGTAAINHREYSETVSIEFTPELNYNGNSASFTVSLNDGLNRIISELIFSVNVTPVDDAPVVGNIPDQTISQGGVFATIALNNYLTEYDGDIVNWTATGAVNLQVNINNQNVATIIPSNPDWSGVESITFIATDNTQQHLSDSDIARFTIVGSPMAVADNYTTNEDTQIDINAANGLLQNDSDPEGNNLVVATVNGSGANVGTQFTLASGATLRVTTTGSFRYNPAGHFNYLAPGETAEDSFVYTNSNGSVQSNSATVVITVTGINDSPILDIETDPHLDTLEGEGNTVEEILINGEVGGVPIVVDPDNNEIGIAIVALNNGDHRGTWEYKYDTNRWLAIPGMGEQEAFILPPSGRIRFTGTGSESATVTFYAWDQSDNETPATLIDYTSTGGTTSLSERSDNITIIIGN